MNKLGIISWDTYEITSRGTKLHGVMLRGRIRKLGVEKNRNVLCENASDKENCVRFAVPHEESVGDIIDYLRNIIEDPAVDQIATNIKNPVLSKLKINQDERYVL